MELKTLQRWWKRQSAADKARIAARAHTTVGYISQVVNGHRKASAEFSAKLVKGNAGLTRGDVCETCARCPYHGDGRNE